MSGKKITSFNLKNPVIEFLKSGAREKNLSAGDFIYFLIEDYQAKKEEIENLKFYLKSMQDSDYLKEQILESELDLQTEFKYKTF